LATTLISVFSILFILVAFNFFEIFSISILGSIGLLFYPLSLFFIVLGILLICNKPIKATKSLIILSIAKENIILCHDCLDELKDLINNIHLICPLNEQEK
jgi:uncharacterized membrane protein YozB (DUF420 family)